MTSFNPNSYSAGTNASGPNWSSLSELGEFQNPSTVEQQKKANLERQQRKIIAALGWPTPDGDPNMEYIDCKDVSLGPGSREMVLEKFRTGVINDRQERKLISDIEGPLDQKYGERAVFQGIQQGALQGDRQSERELRIAGYMMEGETGFNNAGKNVNESYVSAICARYRLPQDFLAASKSLLDGVERSNGPSKREAYSKAVHDFAHRVYGKKYEYYMALDELKKEVFSDTITGQYQEPSSSRSELELSSEWIPGESGSCQISRAQSRSGLINKRRLEEGLIPDESCEDAELIRSDQNLYGVFDGAGGENNSRAAALLSSEVINQLCDKYTIQTGKGLAWALDQANKAVCLNHPSVGCSTGVLTKIVYDGAGNTRLAYASVGDSRIYIVDQSGKARLITKDESVGGNQLFNYLGRFDQLKGFNITTKYGDIDLSSGDRIILCSDGITGDRGDDLMSEAEIGEIVSHSRNPEDAARNLVNSARKHDDRTAVVVAV